MVVDFFKGAFYGWDKNGYLITGWVEGTQFSKIKNVVKGLRLIPIEKSTYHGDKLISRKKGSVSLTV